MVTEARSSMKRCLPEVKARYKASVKDSAHDISSTFTVSTCQVSGFTRYMRPNDLRALTFVDCGWAQRALLAVLAVMH